jgi:hypothetical protein
MADIPYLFRSPLNPYTINDPAVRPELPATAGGQGSFSYLDTKVYGPRQQRQLYDMYRKAWVYTHSSQNRTDGAFVENVPISPPLGFIIPGTGGSAKAPGGRYFGSRAIGYSPNGLVLIRLIKI